MTEVPVVKQQHYVPQFHLKQWSDGTEPHRIGVYDKARGKTFVAPTRDLGGQKWFYHGRGEAQPVEQILAKLEGHASRVYRKLIEAEDAAALGEADLIALRMHIMALSVRTAEHRAGTRELYESLANRILEQMGVPDWKLVFNEDVHRVAQLESVLDAIPRHEILVDHQVSLYVNETTVPFLTSDHPLTRHNDVPPKPGGGGRLGLASPHVQLYLPIGPRHCILLFNVKRDEIVVPSRQPMKDPKHGLFVRSLQLGSSHSQVFGKPEETFEPEREFIAAHPELADPKRQRFTEN